ncbi:MAG: 30S ribosomal protein S6 [Desulfobacteraceae bacterium]|nr:30S ribosomal protein S6 [Desulfobacteraceae bacterium]
MRKYETVFISDPDLQDQARLDLYDKVRNIIAKESGILLNFDEWGNKKMAYEIKKKLRGNYVCATYGGTGELVKELERNFRLTDDILKFMTILLTDDVTIESLEQEVADAKEAEQAAEAAAEERAKAAAAKAEAEAAEAATSDETKESDGTKESDDIKESDEIKEVQD